MKVHSSLAGRLGITGEEIENLIELDQKKFEYREWLALRYAQDFIFTGGQEPAGDYMENFRREYGGRERGYILKLVRLMRFANYWNNTFSGRPWKSGIKDACGIDAGRR